jgi:hypothetical protein
MVSKKLKTAIKPKVIYRTAKPKFTLDKEQVKREISDLEEKKQKAIKGKTGIKKFFAGASYTKAIKERQAKLGRSDAIVNIRQQIELEKAKRELESVRPKRVDFRDQKQITFESLGGSSSGGKGRIKFEDLY